MKHHLNYGNTVSESHMAAANMGWLPKMFLIQLTDWFTPVSILILEFAIMLR
jgi:hypothetical protein